MRSWAIWTAVLMASAGPAAAQAPSVQTVWPDYQIIVWQHQIAPRLAGLKRIGVTGGGLIADRDHLDAVSVAPSLEPFQTAQLRPYIENIATDFYSAYHRWTPDHTIDWLFEDARRLHAANPSDPAAFIRAPGLSDPAALSAVRERMVAAVHAYAPGNPLYYSLGDETGVAELSANWDFDLAPTSLAAMRVWLAQRYGSLDALNAEWGTRFATWDAVRPMLTTEAMRQADENFAAWSDFKDWMDEAFSRAVRVGTVAVHEADPRALAAIEGAQVPGWGGYDYARLSGAVDVMEIYPGYANMDVAHALNPSLVLLTTVFSGTLQAQHDVWEALLSGSRGLVLWDEAGTLVDDRGDPGPMGQALAPLFAELRGKPGRAILAATPHRDPVALLYSPASFRVSWMLEHRSEGDNWTRRTAEVELQNSPYRAAVTSASYSLARLGIEPGWVSPDDLAGGLARSGLRILVLPHAIALSDSEVAALHAFADAGGTILADLAPGAFDGHGRRRANVPELLWTPLFEAALSHALAISGVVPTVRLSRPDGSPAPDLVLRTWQDGARIVVAVSCPTHCPGTETFVASWSTPRTTIDLRRGADLGRIATLSATVTGPGPFLFSIEEP